MILIILILSKADKNEFEEEISKFTATIYGVSPQLLLM